MDHDTNESIDRKLHLWGSPIAQRKPDQICSHCSNPFVGSEGMVSDDFSLCPACDARD
ncbi:hypothetical protein [Sphingomonas rubra]|uniref:hypothetical protein n=1 Tax=Sphingomonas rubra TaxID=634430 RepID=UPI0015A50FA4|nr:hypothetical protein [Sphingomonas rubra]